MSDRAKEFLDDFIQGLQATGTQIGNDGEAHSVTQAAIMDASQDGISEDELRSAADGDLDQYLRNALASDEDE